MPAALANPTHCASTAIVSTPVPLARTTNCGIVGAGVENDDDRDRHRNATGGAVQRAQKFPEVFDC